MKKCSYCGAEYSDDKTVCPIDRTSLETPAASPRPQPTKPIKEFELVPLSDAERENDLVTLVRCATLVSADMVAANLRGAGIEVFLPDEFLMQSVGWNMNTFGYVRVQVSPKDYDSARELLAGDH
jgi:hypothetical protein